MQCISNLTDYMDKSHNKQIAVMDKIHKSINVITVTDNILQSYACTEEYLREHCFFDIDNIFWMINDNITINANLNNESF